MKGFVVVLLGTVLVGEADAEPYADFSHSKLGDPAVAAQDSGTYLDPRDGQAYSWVRIGDQVWMAENLRYATEQGSWCWDDDEGECIARGRFYNWDIAQRVAPPGWHLPTDREWKILEGTLGIDADALDAEGDRTDVDQAAGGKLKSVADWPREYAGQQIVVTDEVGFSAIPTGLYSHGEFSHEGYAAWWTSTDDGEEAWIRVLRFFDSRISRLKNNKSYGIAVRCVRDVQD